ncbi:hypothetical protein WDU94_012258 [Cyamophila willieti]
MSDLKFPPDPPPPPLSLDASPMHDFYVTPPSSPILSPPPSLVPSPLPSLVPTCPPSLVPTLLSPLGTLLEPHILPLPPSPTPLPPPTPLPHPPSLPIGLTSASQPANSCSFLQVPRKKQNGVTLAQSVRNNVRLDVLPIIPDKDVPPSFKPSSLVKRVEAKIADFDVRGAVKLISSTDSLASFSNDNLQEMIRKHLLPRDLSTFLLHLMTRHLLSLQYLVL